MHAEWLHFYTCGQGSFGQAHSGLLGLAVRKGKSLPTYTAVQGPSLLLSGLLCSVFDELLFKKNRPCYKSTN